MFSSFSYRVLFQRFFPQNISLLPKIVTEAHANLKKKKTSCNTTLKHYAVMVKYTPLELSSLLSSLIYLLAGSMFHLFIIKVHMDCGALLHSAHFLPALYHFMNKKKAGFTHSCVLFITKCDTVYYKLRQVFQSTMDLLQSAMIITNCDSVSDTLILVFVNEHCCLCICFTELHSFWLLVVSLVILIAVPFVFSCSVNIACRSTQNAAR